MSRKWLVSILMVSVMVVLANPSESTYSAVLEKYTISLEAIGVVFELPKEYAVLQREFSEPYYATTISFGKEIRPGHLRYAPFEMAFWPTAYDGTRAIPEYRPSQYVEVEFERWKGAGAEYVTLFGNKAVRYSYAGMDHYTVIVGYFRTDQLPKSTATHAAMHVSEYLVRIAVTRNIPQVEFDKAYKQLIDTVVDSLRISK